MMPTLEEFVKEEIQEHGLRLYFDTSVILDLLRPNRRPQSQELLDLTMANDSECTSSYFALMEALDIEQENMWFRNKIRAGEDVDSLLRRRQKRDPLSPQASGRLFNQMYGRFVKEKQDFISWVILDEEAWDEALRLAMTSNIRAPDCIHVAAAVTMNCNMMITSDEILRDLANQHVHTANPIQMTALLNRISGS